MELLKNIVTGIHVIICVALIIIALMQAKEDAGMSQTITGSSSNNFLEKNKGRTKEGKLKRWTIILAVAFGISTIALGIVYVF